MSSVPSVSTPKSYSDLVKKAYIDPIRSALIVDDNYPTWENIHKFKYRATSDASGPNTAPSLSEFRNLIKGLRKDHPKLNIDIRDRIDDKTLINNLHQTDLLILDYHLDGNLDKGNKACEIIRSLAANNHFNMVIIHTAEKELNDPFYRMMKLITEKPKNFAIENEIDEETYEKIDEINRYNEKTLNGFISDKLLFEIIAQKNNNYFELLKKIKNLGYLDKEFDANGCTGHQKNDIFKYIISNRLNEFSDCGEDISNIKWNDAENSKNLYWIRTNKIFIVFLKKYSRGLLKKLQSAIEKWGPTPSRLLANNIRSEISDQGVIAEDKAFNNNKAQAFFYHELSNISGKSDDETIGKQKNLIEMYSSRYLECIYDIISEKINQFGFEILDSDSKKSKNKIGHLRLYSKTCVGDKLRKECYKEYNSYISTKPVSGWHLQPGHIMEFCNNLWICVSPACDLVPGQKTSIAIHGLRNSTIKPFVAIQLKKWQPTGGSGNNKNNTSNAEDGKKANALNMVYLSKGENEYNAYSIYNNDETRFGSPLWRLFYAENHGIIYHDSDKIPSIKLSYIKANTSQMEIKSNEVAKIIGQLRYEYALNLIQKLGTELTRIGLDLTDPL